jgi:hypothetical protein
MMSVLVDPDLSDSDRRDHLYAGDLLLFRPRASTRALCERARAMLEDAFHPFEPREAQHHLPVERYAAILAELKPAFIHHPESKRLIRELLSDFRCEPELTFFDVPRLRSSTSDGYLTTGIAYAFHPHRDTWYSAPLCQINWWIPLHALAPDDGLAFHPRYWSRAVKNGSRLYNYAEWNRTSRFSAAGHIRTDLRVQPKPEDEMDLSDDLRIVCDAGGMVVFSAAQMHSSVTNTSGRTRFSIDFRTVHLADVEAGRGAPNVDSECTGTTMGDYLRCSDLAHVPAGWIHRYDEGFGR